MRFSNTFITHLRQIPINITSIFSFPCKKAGYGKPYGTGQSTVLLFAASDWPNKTKAFLVKWSHNKNFEKQQISTLSSLACPKKILNRIFFSLFLILHAYKEKEPFMSIVAQKSPEKKVSSEQRLLNASKDY